MNTDIKKSKNGGRTVYLNMGVWYDEDQGHLHLTLPNSGWFHTTVNNNPESVRGHPNLFKKLAKALKHAGAPGPEVKDSD